MLGGLIAAKWGWQAAFGVVGVPGLVLALLYLKVRDYRTVDLTPELNQATKSTGSTASSLSGRSCARRRCRGFASAGGAADRRFGDVVVAAELPEPLPRHRA